MAAKICEERMNTPGMQNEVVSEVKCAKALRSPPTAPICTRIHVKALTKYV